MCEDRTTLAAPFTFPKPQLRLQSGQHKQSNSHQRNQQSSCWLVCDVFRGWVRVRCLCLPVTYSQLCASIATIVRLLVKLICFQGTTAAKQSRPRHRSTVMESTFLTSLNLLICLCGPIHPPPADKQNAIRTDSD